MFGTIILNNMRYKIIQDVDISGNKRGDYIEAEPHAMEEYIAKGQVEIATDVKFAELKDAKVVVKDEVKKELSIARDKLKAELDKRGIKYFPNNKTAKLIELLENDNKS